MNSPKDLSEVIEFDKDSKRMRSTHYSASYNRKTRKRKYVEAVYIFSYDSLGKISSIVDTLGVGYIQIYYFYNSEGRISKKEKNLGNFHYVSTYSYNPLIKTTIRTKDSVIVYHKTTEYDQDFYERRVHGYVMESKLKRVTTIIDGVENTLAYSDETDLQRFNEDRKIVNTFDEQGRILTADVHSIFMNDRVFESFLRFDYYKNGLLKSERGYVPMYFKYEFWE